MNICCVHKYPNGGEDRLIDMQIYKYALTVDSDVIRWYLVCPECGHCVLAIMGISNTWKPGAMQDDIPDTST